MSSSSGPVASSSSSKNSSAAHGESGGGGPGLLRRVLRKLIAPVRPVLRAIRHLPDRLRHSRRRRRAEERLREGRPFGSIVVLCVGNVCRSPYAERVLHERLGSEGRGPTIRSAGFSGWDRSSPPQAVAEASGRGVDLSKHRSRMVTLDLVESTDLFVVTDLGQRRDLERNFGVEARRIVHLGDLDPRPIDTRTVEDPWGKEREVFRESYDRIDRCLDRLVAILTEERD